MKVQVKVKAHSQQVQVIPHGDKLLISLTAPAYEGKANKQLIEVLARYYQTKPNKIIIATGLTNSVKTILILK